MVANRAYKFRIYPNDEQRILFAKTFGCVRMVYNHWLDRKIRQYEDQVQEKEMQKFLGLDFSMHELYRDSNDKEPAYPRYYRNAAGKCMTLTQYNTTVGHTGIARLCLAQ